MVQFHKHDLQRKIVKGFIICFVLCHHMAESYVRVYKREIPYITSSFIVPTYSLIAMIHVS
jgi:hypothetical protein